MTQPRQPQEQPELPIEPGHVMSREKWQQMQKN